MYLYNFFLYKDRHKFYDFMSNVFLESKYSFFMIKTLSSRFEFKFKNNFFKFIILVVDMFYVVFSSYKNSKHDFIFIREFNTIPFLLSAIFLFPIRSKLLLNVNHNFQRACSSKLHEAIIRFIDAIGFNFFCFEDSSICFKLKHTVVEIPFLIHNEKNVQFSKESNMLTVGVVGSIRPEKNIIPLLVKLDEIKSSFRDVNFLLGSDDCGVNLEYKNKGWNVLDTRIYDDYIRAINESDILIFNYDVDCYKYRHSGVITDSILNNKIVVVPEYPYFLKQISSPVEVGVAFESIDAIGDALKKAIVLTNSADRKLQYHRYCEYRRLNQIVSNLDRQLGSIYEK